MKILILIISLIWLNNGRPALAQDIVWYVEGQPQAPLGPTNPPNTVGPDVSIPPENATTTASSNSSETTVSTTASGSTASPNATTLAPDATTASSGSEATTVGATGPAQIAPNLGSYIAGLESFVWGSAGAASSASSAGPASGVTAIPAVPSDLIVKLCGVADLKPETLCPSAEADPGCTSLASALGASYKPECARSGLCSVVESSAGVRLFVWKVDKNPSCTALPVRVSFLAPKKGTGKEDFVKDLPTNPAEE